MTTKNITLSLLAAALLASAPAYALAQGPDQADCPDCPARMARCERPMHRAPHLSAEQAAQMEKFRSEHRAALAPLRDSLMQKKMELHALAPNPNVKPEELKALVSDIVSLRKQMRALGEEYRAKMEKAGLPCPRFRQDCDGPRGPRHDFHGFHDFHHGCER